MGILDGILGAVMGGNQQGDAKSAIIQTVIGLIGQQAANNPNSGAMGAVGGLLSQFLGNNQQSGGISQIAQLLGAATSNSQGGSPLNAILGMFQNSGLAEQAQSWVSTGQNLPVSGEQVQQALGSDVVQAFAKQANIDPSQAANQLADVLPEIINTVTPNGQVPTDMSQVDIAGLIGKFLNRS
jgi:uncharacterized protein YidB (DUF937 family)